MSQYSKKGFEELAKEASLMPQEKLQAIGKKYKRLKIGIPKEITYQENRVPVSPLSVQLLVNNGHEVIMETNAGENANFSDYHFSNAGAQIVQDSKEVYASDLILKIDPPTLAEVDLMKSNQILISALQLTNLKEELVRKLMSKQVTAIAYEFLRDKSDALPIIRAMSEIAGRAAIFIASENLSNYNQGKGELFGGIPGIQPTQVVIIGAGAVGEYATRAAVGLGANVKVFDNSLHKLRRIESNLGHRIYSSTIIPEILGKALSQCDVAIGSLRSEIGYSPCVVTENMVQNMRDKSIIVDISIDQGGCFETSKVTNHKQPTFVNHGVIHYCVPNIPSLFSRTASYALSNVFTPLLIRMGQEGGINVSLQKSKGLRDGTYLFKGKLTNTHLAERFAIPSKEIEFLLAGY